MDSPEVLQTVWQEREKHLSGLSSEEAKSRLQQYGLNELPRHQESWIRGFLAYFWGPIPWAFMVTVGICVVARLWPEAEIIAAGSLTLALIGCTSEYSGRRRVWKLRARLNRNVRVERDGVWQELPATELVPGDLIQLQHGDVVPADVRLVEGDGIAINVVHPSYPVHHVFMVGDLLYGGSPIDFGEAYAIVYMTGAQTQLGRKVQRLVRHMNATRFYESAIFKFDKSILHFDEPLGGERTTVSVSEDHKEPSP